MSLVAHWKMDDAAGQKVVVDSAGTNTGTAANNIVSVPGKVGNAIEFNGIADFIDTSSINAYNATAFSVAFWVKGAAQDDKRVFADGSSSSNDPVFSMGAGNSAPVFAKLRIFIRSDASASLLDNDTDADVFDNTWHHVVYTEEAGVYKTYIDGVLDAGVSGTYTPAALTLDASAIGAISRIATDKFFAGTLDDVRLYDTALTAEEVRAIFNQALRNNKWESAKSEWRYFI